MRAYFMGNYYLSSIQQGIQAVHCVVGMAMTILSRNGEDSVAWDNYCDWAQNHKTMVLLNGGNQEALEVLSRFLDSPDNDFNWGVFSEDKQSLNNCLTCVGIIIPERIYEAATLIRQRNTVVIKSIDDPNIRWVVDDKKSVDYELTNWEYELCTLLNGYRLAI